VVSSRRFSGVLAPAITPFEADLSVSPARFVRHCRWLLDHGCTGLAVFGTNSEANSLTVEERMALLEALIDAGIPAGVLMPGTGCCSFLDSVRLTAHAVRAGCGGVLMLPPFYYKGVSAEGLFRSFSEVIERVGDARLQLYLYHIPPVAQVPIPLDVIGRLLERYPGTVAGVKDSSGDWKNTLAMLERFAPSGFEVFAGSEVFLLANMRHGGVGCISATANVNPARIRCLFDHWQDGNADAVQEELAATRAVVQKYPMIAALKAIVSHYSGDPQWAAVRPPLVELSASERVALTGALDTRGFTW
jgi:4-hydroxy-tetrahydrodipicolinate synthase